MPAPNELPRSAQTPTWAGGMRPIRVFNTTKEKIAPGSCLQFAQLDKEGKLSTVSATDKYWAAIQRSGEPMFAIQKPDYRAKQQDPSRYCFSGINVISEESAGAAYMEFPIVAAAVVRESERLNHKCLGPVVDRWYLDTGSCWPILSRDPTKSIEYQLDGSLLKAGGYLIGNPRRPVCYGQAHQIDRCFATVDLEPDQNASYNSWSEGQQLYNAGDPIRMGQVKTTSDGFDVLTEETVIIPGEQFHKIGAGLASVSMEYGAWGLKPSIPGRYKVAFSATVINRFEFELLGLNYVGVTVGAYDVDKNEALIAGRAHGYAARKLSTIPDVLPNTFENVSSSCIVEVRAGQEIIMRAWHQAASADDTTRFVWIGLATMTAELVEPFIAADTHPEIDVPTRCVAPPPDPNDPPPDPDPAGHCIYQGNGLGGWTLISSGSCILCAPPLRASTGTSDVAIGSCGDEEGGDIEEP